MSIRPHPKTTRPRRPLAALLWAATWLVALALIGACGGRGGADETPTSAPTNGPARTFELGLSSLPAELTDEGYEAAFARAAEAGEVILIKRAPPWSDFVEGGALSKETVATTQRETALAAQYDLEVFFAIDPLGGAGGAPGPIPGLPDDLRGAGFDDPQVRQAFTAYATYVAVNYQPKYLALGVEVNTLQRTSPENFEQFVSLYQETYEVVKAEAPDTLVFPTFQLETLAGRLPTDDDASPQWDLIQRFEPRMDLLAVSTYPSLVFDRPADIPDDYFSVLRRYSDRPIAIAETGYPSRDVGTETKSDETRQANFLRRVLDEATDLRMPLVVWFIGQDPIFAGPPAFTLIEHIGLLRQDGSAKRAWAVWQEAVQRPLEPDASGLRRPTRAYG